MQTSISVAPAPAEFGERLIPLCDGRRGLRGGLRVDIREPGVAGRLSEIDDTPGPSPSSEGAVLDFVASNESLDRYDEIVVAGGWALENYRRNPVFQNAHQYGDIIFTLGKALLTEVRGQSLYQRIEFATQVNPMARIAYGLYRGKFLNAVSVGFIPLRWENGDESSGFRRRYLEQELLEVSAVGIPANPEALQLGLKSGAIERSDLKDLLELTLARALPPHSVPGPVPGDDRPIPSRSIPAASNTLACASGVRGYEAQMLQLGRLLRKALKG